MAQRPRDPFTESRAAARDPFQDPRDPFADPSRQQNADYGAGARSDQFSRGQDPEKAASRPPSVPHNPYARYDDPASQPSGMQPDDEPKRRGLVFKQLWVILLLIVVLVGAAIAIPVGINLSKKSPPKSNSGLAVNDNGTLKPVAEIAGFPSIIDPATPKEALTSKSLDGSADYQLVFSDEFNTDGRTFYAGDDPFWEAADLHYWQTGNLEWYDPSQITTKNGSLQITLEKVDDPSTNHDLSYKGGMMMTWNKFCFTGGRVESAVRLPGANNVMGLWPAVWAMGNLGRAGYGASLEGMWPYTYDSCDVGTLKNQTLQNEPVAATVNGDLSHGGVLSFLPGQRLSRCTCGNDPTHPGPKHPDGTFVGRSAPEIDMFEATISGQEGLVSQSGQWAPFNEGYRWFNTTDNLIINDPTVTDLNGYRGGVFQQAISSVTKTNQQCYELTGGCFSVYGFEYKPGFDDAYITWVTDNKVAWTMKAAGTKADANVEIGDRPVPQEPMYLIMNLGISESFGFVDVEHLVFPTTMSVDYIRVYQPKDAINTGCDPKDFPTASYIAKFPEAYTNENLTTFVDDFKKTFPKNTLIDQC